MKKLISISTRLSLFLLAALMIQSCVKNEYDEPPVYNPPVGEELTIQELKALCDNNYLQIDEDMSVYATVTMDDKSGNVYKTAYVQDTTGAIKLSLDASGTLVTGQKVRLYLNGACLIKGSDDLIAVDSLDAYLNIIRLESEKHIEPAIVTIEDVKLGNYENMLVKLEGVQFNEGDLGTTYSDPVGLNSVNKTLEDCDGNSLIVRTSGYANFAGENVAEGKGSIIAIAGSYRGDAQLYIRDLSEVGMTGERCGGSGSGTIGDPVDEIDEKFDGAVDYTDISVEGWQNIAEIGDRRWQGKTYNSDKYIQASGYNSGQDALVSWMITPPVNITSDMTFSFKTAQAYWTHSTVEPLEVLMSTNYDGTNLETANWETVDATLASQSDAEHAWIESGDVDLSAYDGQQVIFAFKYTGSDSESTSIRIDDVLVSDGTGGGGGTGGGSLGTPVDEIDEQFLSAEDYEDIAITDWFNVNEIGDRKWQGKTFSDEKYAQATGYNSGLDAMVCWLMTPPVNVQDDTKLSFETAKAYWAHSGNPLELLVSADFDGENLATANWISLDATIASESDADHAWIASGDVDLSSYSGQQLTIAFKYTGSDSESTSIRIDNILVTTDNGGGTGGGGSFEPFIESFDSSLGSFSPYDVEGGQAWEHATYDGGCVKMSGYSGGSSNLNEDWLISPEIDMTDHTGAVLTVRQAAGYINDDWDQISIMVSSDYSSGDPTGATWTEVEAPNMPAGNNFDFVDSGDIDISAFDGETIHVAFKYISTSGNSSTWEISTVEVK